MFKIKYDYVDRGGYCSLDVHCDPAHEAYDIDLIDLPSAEFVCALMKDSYASCYPDYPENFIDMVSNLMSSLAHIVTEYLPCHVSCLAEGDHDAYDNNTHPPGIPYLYVFSHEEYSVYFGVRFDDPNPCEVMIGEDCFEHVDAIYFIDRLPDAIKGFFLTCMRFQWARTEHPYLQNFLSEYLARCSNILARFV